MTSLYVLSVFLYSSFVLFLGIITRGKMLFFLFFWGGCLVFVVLGFCFCLLRWIRSRLTGLSWLLLCLLVSKMICTCTLRFFPFFFPFCIHHYQI